MALPPEFDQPAWYSVRRLDRAIGRGQARVFRVLWFRVPPGSVAWNVSFQALLASRFLSDIALQALLYGVLIRTAREGGGALDAALIGTAYLLPGMLLGLFGGAVADAVPKRIALAGAYIAMGGLCFVIPGLFGTRFRSLLLVIFAVRSLHQVSAPSEASAVPLVASSEELASANSFLSLAGSVGEVVGKALIAPLLVVAFDVDIVIALAGVLFFASASRVLPLEHRPPPAPAVVEGAVARVPSVRAALRWLVDEPAAFWMLMLAAMASTVNVVLAVLAPQYVLDVLNVDPANALYVFAPASLGVVAGLLLAPPAIALARERAVATVGFALVAAAMVALGLVTPISERFGWILVLDIPRVGTRVEMAGALSLPLGLGITLASAATQTYIGRYVPTAIHGRVFALLGVMKDGMAIVPLLALGALASVVGVRTVITVAPGALLALAYGIEWYAARWREPGMGGRLAPVKRSGSGRRWRRTRR
ncbi:MAG: MFS transporter [Chloroflexi bacterium]|nr:MFS transporter [Chloroflexota bacterium]MDA1004092.1 MFS transporter [Chloroflexota bacterium]